MEKNNKVSDNSLDEFLKELSEKNTSKYISDHILQTARQPWKCSTDKGQDLISFEVEFSGERSQEDQLRWLTRDNQLFGSNQPLNGSFSVVLSDNNSRIESNGKSVHGENFIYITGKENGFLFIDKTSKTYLHFPEDRKINHSFNDKIDGSVTICQNENSKITASEIILNAPYKLKYVLELDTDKKWLPYSHNVIDMIIGCSNLYKESGLDLDPIIKTGIPVKGEVYIEQFKGRWQKMSSFAVRDLKSTDFKTNPFDIPEGYRDLQKVNKEHKKDSQKTPFGPAIKLSDYRTSEKRKFNYDDWKRNEANKNGKSNEDEIQRMNQYLNDRDSFKSLRSDNLRFPTCLPETYGALISNLVDEKLLDDIQYMINGVTKRLTGFNGSSGLIDIDWMNQFKAHADTLAISDPGGGLYELLHDEMATNTTTHPQKLGLLDKLAVSTLSKLLADGDNLASLSLNAVLQNAVNVVLSDSSIAAENRFSALTIENQGLLIDDYLFKGLGKIALSYPSSTGTQTIFYDLLNVRLDDIKFDIRINNSEIIDTLSFDADSIHLVIKLPEASGEAWHTRWPTARYWGLLGISAISCFFFPFTCFLFQMAVLVGLFLALDAAFVTLKLSNMVIDSHIRLVPNGSNVLQPDVQLTLDADVSAFYMSVIPTGVHQIISLIYDIILNATNLVINTIESQLKDQLNDYLKNDLKITYPPDFGPVPLVGISNDVEFVAEDHGYVEQALNAGLMSVINPYITQIDSEVKSKISTLRDQYKSDFTDPVDKYIETGTLGWVSADMSNVSRYYLGTVLSQNFINTYVYTLWRQLFYNYDFSQTETDDLFNLLKTAFPDLKSLEGERVKAKLWPAVPPRTLFTPYPASRGKYYATTFFDDVRICFGFKHRDKKLPDIMEFSFAGQVVTEIGFGGYNPIIGKLDLLKLTDRLFDIYFDLKTVGVNIIHPEVEYFSFKDMEPSVNFDYSPLDLLQEMFKRGLQYSLSKRDSAFIPRNPGDPQYIQRYPLGNDALQVVFQLVPFRGNLYISKGMSGKATAIYKGALDIDAMSKVIGQILRSVI